MPNRQHASGVSPADRSTAHRAALSAAVWCTPTSAPGSEAGGVCARSSSAPIGSTSPWNTMTASFPQFPFSQSRRRKSRVGATTAESRLQAPPQVALPPPPAPIPPPCGGPAPGSARSRPPPPSCRDRSTVGTDRAARRAPRVRPGRVQPLAARPRLGQRGRRRAGAPPQRGAPPSLPGRRLDLGEVVPSLLRAGTPPRSASADGTRGRGAEHLPAQRDGLAQVPLGKAVLLTTGLLRLLPQLGHAQIGVCPLSREGLGPRFPSLRAGRQAAPAPPHRVRRRAVLARGLCRCTAGGTPPQPPGPAADVPSTTSGTPQPVNGSSRACR